MKLVPCFYQKCTKTLFYFKSPLIHSNIHTIRIFFNEEIIIIFAVNRRQDLTGIKPEIVVWKRTFKIVLTTPVEGSWGSLNLRHPKRTNQQIRMPHLQNQQQNKMTVTRMMIPTNQLPKRRRRR